MIRDSIPKFDASHRINKNGELRFNRSNTHRPPAIPRFLQALHRNKGPQIRSAKAPRPCDPPPMPSAEATSIASTMARELQVGWTDANQACAAIPPNNGDPLLFAARLGQLPLCPYIACTACGSQSNRSKLCDSFCAALFLSLIFYFFPSFFFSLEHTRVTLRLNGESIVRAEFMHWLCRCLAHIAPRPSPASALLGQTFGLEMGAFSPSSASLMNIERSFRAFAFAFASAFASASADAYTACELRPSS